MRQIRISIVITVILLICIGIIMIYSSSGIYALQKTGDSMYYLNRHLIFLSIGAVLMILSMSIDYRILQPFAKPILLGVLVLLVLVLIPGIGRQSFGARRWFKLGAFSFQPSEFAKLAMLIYTSDFLSRKRKDIKSFWTGFLPILMVLGLVCALILKQPDLGNTVSIAFIAFVMIFVAGTRPMYLAAIGLMTIPGFYYLVMKVPYRLRRIVAFIDPWKDSQGSGFQLIQSQVALGSGGLLGVGLGKSMQKLFYLPAAHTDFILSIIGEETGLAGTLTVVLLFLFFVWQGVRIVIRVTDSFGYYLSMGIVLMIGFQAMVNIGVSIGALPTKGLPLPFISYGGSALIFNMIALGLLLNISRIQDLSV